MKIGISDNFRFTSDADNFILEKSRIAEKGKHKGETVWKQVGFYRTFDDMCRGLLRREMLDCDAETIEELCAVTRGVQACIEEVRNLLALKENPENTKGN